MCGLPPQCDGARSLVVRTFKRHTHTHTRATCFHTPTRSLYIDMLDRNTWVGCFIFKHSLFVCTSKTALQVNRPHAYNHANTQTHTPLGCVSVPAKDSVSGVCDVMAGWLSAVTATPITILDLASKQTICVLVSSLALPLLTFCIS